MTWEMKIRKVDNGFVLEWEEENEEGTKILQQTVIEEDDTDEEGELKCMEKLLNEIKEYFGVHYSKHDKKNLFIEIKGKNGKEENG